MKIKVLIADDNSFIREGMKIILSSFEDFEVVGTAEDGAEAVSFCLGQAVDVALLDVRMPNLNGVEAARQLTERTKTKPLILTTFDDDEYILEAVRAGARGYLLKNNDPERIRDAIANRIVYNLEAQAAPPDTDPVDYVLFEQKEAYCDIYASAMVLLARSAGIPARYAVGYLPDETERDDNGIYVVLESDLHAWAELFFKDYGWVVFDATSGSRSWSRRCTSSSCSPRTT